MSYEETLEKVILRLDREEKEKDKRIAELEKEKAIGVYHFTVEEYKAHNLEQQAKALQFALENITNPDLLYSRLKALKEQGK